LEIKWKGRDKRRRGITVGRRTRGEDGKKGDGKLGGKLCKWEEADENGREKRKGKREGEREGERVGGCGECVNDDG
jgi:hypothetical protein